MGNTLIVLPRSVLLSRPALQDIKPNWVELTAHQMLALFICMDHNNPEGPYYEFVSQLPRIDEFLNMPLLWPDEKLKLLPSALYGKVMAQREKFEADLVAVCAVEPDVQRDLYEWAWICVNTRCVYMDIGQASRDDNMVMAPYLDFLNHSTDSTKSVAVESKGHSLVVKALSSYQPGDEVYLSYGAHDNGFLLIEYGFTIPGNPWDYIDITSQVQQMCSSEQKKVLQELGYWGEYTVNTKEMSFRTEIALACIQESTDAGFRRIKNLTMGYLDPDAWEAESRKILKQLIQHAAERPDKLPQVLVPIYDGYETISRQT